MKTQKPNAELVWKQFTDFLIPQFRLSIADRAIYAHLLRHSRLEGKQRLHFSIGWLARSSGLTVTPARHAVRRLAAHGILRMLERSKKGHVIDVRLPSEVRVRTSERASQRLVTAVHNSTLMRRGPSRPATPEISTTSARMNRRTLRSAIFARDRGLCFYCLRRLSARTRCLDHVIPNVQGGKDSFTNLVSSCVDCNSVKRDKSAPDHLRCLYREGRLTSAELSVRLRALKTLAAGRLRPLVPTE
jgi:5-methylcytosine-specific restriction endonuclease McrA